MWSCKEKVLIPCVYKTDMASFSRYLFSNQAENE